MVALVPTRLFNSLRVIVASVEDLRALRAAREEQATLWPAEELPIEGDRSVISGHMRELMNYARRIAKTKVNVLITGESGTGKELVAQAVHQRGPHKTGPLVAFNCAAVPDTML